VRAGGGGGAMEEGRHFPPAIPTLMFRIGISGWTYAGWRGVFYPPELPHRRELEFASREFSTIEINGTHYSLQRPSSFESWRAATPDGFTFSVKGSRFITHLKQLRDIETPLANFFASGVLALREKLGPFLWQFPPRFRFRPELFEHFLTLLPRDTIAAARLAKRHDARLEGRAFTQSGGRRALRHAVEIRHESFMVPEFFRLLRRQKIAFVFADTAGKWPYSEDLTTDFAYVRLHGAEELYSSGYSPGALDWWADRLRHWSHGTQPADAQLILPPRRRPVRELFVYFDNDAKVKAPGDARQLQVRVDALERPK
jgi:uncharacterized protein YecE (DUF72 family)